MVTRLMSMEKREEIRVAHVTVDVISLPMALKPLKLHQNSMDLFDWGRPGPQNRLESTGVWSELYFAIGKYGQQPPQRNSPGLFIEKELCVTKTKAWHWSIPKTHTILKK